MTEPKINSAKSVFVFIKFICYLEFVYDQIKRGLSLIIDFQILRVETLCIMIKPKANLV